MLLHGRIDNLAQVAGQLGLSNLDPCTVYAEAVNRWGAEADNRVVGNYCSIVVSETGIRAARSPWDAPPLCFASFDGQSVVASVPRAILAAGLPNRPDRVKLADNMYFNLLDRTRGWYEGMQRVAYGTVVTIDPTGQSRVHTFYDPGSLPSVRFANDDDYVEAAQALVSDAARCALAGAQRPGMMLSGGLDSPLVAAAVLGGLPQDQTLPSFTFAPLDAWRDTLPDGLMGDERAFVAAFAAMHPRLQPHFTQNDGIGFDHRLTDFFAAMGSAPNHLCNFYVYHGVWQGARDAGCDVLLTADFGNQTFSNRGDWGYAEYLRTMRLRQLWLAARDRPGDPRPLWQKIAALSLLRVLPPAVRRAVRSRRHPGRQGMNSLLSLLPDRAVSEAAARAEAHGALIEAEYPATHAGSVAFDYAWRDCEGAEVQQGFEQIYGLRAVDVPTYRPLAEFCAGVPTDQFLRDGKDRWLARRMARGRLPEAQRLNTRYGRHNADWHERLTPRLGEFRQAAHAMAGDPDLADLIDTRRIDALLDSWPDESSHELDVYGPYAAALPRGLLTAQFVRYVSGRNAP